jgi:hypothetical protein
MQRFLLPILTFLVLALIVTDRLSRHSVPVVLAVAPEPARSLAESGFPARSSSASSVHAPVTGTPTIERLARLAVRKTLNAESKSTYLDSLLLSTDSMLRRWPTPMGRPLSVAIVEGGPASYQPRMAGYVRDALRMWQNLGIDLELETISDTLNADMVVHWIDRFPIDRTGQTDLTWDQFGRVRHAVITLAIADGRGTKLPAPALLSVAIHEIGHAIGLPHSADPADVMFPEPRTSTLSPRDRRTAVVLYQLPSGSVKDSIGL